MNKGLTVNELIKIKSTELKNALGVDLCHPTSQGDNREMAWIDFLESFLPKRYAVAKGFIFDSKGKRSEQIDAIIYDPHHSPLIYKGANGECYITAESVYAVFEIKPKADKSNLEYAKEKIDSVRGLARTSRGMISSGNYVPPRTLTRIIGGLLCSEAIGVSRLVSHLEKTEGVDIVCVPDVVTAYKRPNGECVTSNGDEALFAFFYVLLDELYKMGTVAAIDIRDYADISLNSIKLERVEP